MYRIIGGDGREYGPVTATQIEQWIAQSRANAATQIKVEGAADWTTVGASPEFAAALAAQFAPPPLPGSFPSQPAPAATSPADHTPAAPAQPTAETARACLGRPYRLSVFDTLGQGWDIVTSRFWLVVGGCLIGALVNGAAGSVPFVGILVTILLTQVFYAGIYWLVLRVARGEPAELGDLFAGFTRSLNQLILLSLVMFFCILGLALIACGPLLWALVRSGVFQGADPDPSLMVAPLLAIPVLMIPLVYLSVSWVFAPILVIDRGLGFGEAMELSRRVVAKHWFRFFFLYLCFIPLMIAGLICFIVGVFVTSALMYAAIVAAYRTAFPERVEPVAPSNRPIGTSDLRG